MYADSPRSAEPMLHPPYGHGQLTRGLVRLRGRFLLLVQVFFWLCKEEVRPFVLLNFCELFLILAFVDVALELELHAEDGELLSAKFIVCGLLLSGGLG